MAKKPATTRSTKTAAAGHAAHGGHDDAPVSSANTIPPAMDYAAHEAMYHRFTDIAKWGILACAVLVIFLFVVIHPMVQVPA